MLHTNIQSRSLKERDYLEDLGVKEKVIVERISKVRYGSMDWTHVAQNRDRRRALVNSAVNFGIP
jgi:hypothetical protein